MRYVVLLTFVLSALGLQAQSRREEFLNITSWRGAFDMKVDRSGLDNGVKWRYQGTATGDLLYETANLSNTPPLWLGKIQNSSVNIRADLSYSAGQCTVTGVYLMSGPLDPVSGAETQVRVFLDVWDVVLNRIIFKGAYTKTTVCPSGTTTQVVNNVGGTIPNLRPLQFPYPAQGFELKVSGQAMGLSGVPDGSTPIPLQGLTWDVGVTLSPVADELMLEVTSPDYETWRPTAEPGPQPGKPIQFTAIVKRASGATAQVNVSRFVWELVDTSREPGIALNFPLIRLDFQSQKVTDFDSDPDLKLDPQPGQFVTGADNQKVERPAPDSAQDSAVVLPYDWGAWSTLQVTAFLSDGGKLVGRYKGSQEDGVRLPKRAKDSYIADAWKKETGASGADSDDNETAPAGEPGCDGDGLTLYEEYRGFYENGKHIGGNPKAKDLFIFNGCGAVAEPGIALFGSLTGLELHKDLLEYEEHNSIGFDYTAINGNFAKGPHRVLQHRVEVTWCGTSRGGGGGNRAIDPGYADNHHLRPKDVKNIYVERPDSRYWIEQFGVSTDDQPRQFDIALAHELFHAVGVEHHGQGDYTDKFRALDAGDPNNPTDHPAWVLPSNGFAITFLDEASGADVTESTARKAQQVRKIAYQLGPTVPLAAQALEEGPEWWVQNYQIGLEHGESSGDENCVMRYWLSDVYPKKGVDLTLYLVPPGTEPVGTQICTSTTGKTINAERNPQPRYFDAAPTRGNCKFWVCVNDAIPGKSSEIPKKSQ